MYERSNNYIQFADFDLSHPVPFIINMQIIIQIPW